MIHLNPKHMIANRIYVVSESEDYKRRVFLGLFRTGVTPDEIKKTILEERLIYKLTTARGTWRIESFPTKVYKGVIFEQADEFAPHLKNNISYEDICLGYEMHEEETCTL